MKVWIYTDEDSGYSTVVYADTRGKAQRMVADENSIPFVKATVSRMQWADQYGDFQNIPPDELLDHGWWLECNSCGSRIIDEHDVLKTPNGNLCRKCYEKERCNHG